MATRVWNDDTAISAATFAVVLGTFSLLGGPTFGGELVATFHDTLDLPLVLSRVLAVALSVFAGAPTFLIVRAAERRARTRPFLAPRRARVARTLAWLTSAFSLLAAIVAIST